MDNTFTVSVSRMAPGKLGYKRNKRDFGNSFHQEQHTAVSLRQLLTTDGYPITAGILERIPPDDLPDNRKVTTMRITENYRGAWVIALDDDGRLPNSIEFWQNDPFFNEYGSFWYETDSSRTKTHSDGWQIEKVRPVFILESPIESHLQHKEILEAFYEKYPRTDRLTDCVRVYYGSPASKGGGFIGKRLPLNVLHDEVIQPYRDSIIRQRHHISLEQAKYIDNIRKRRGSETELDDAYRAFIKGRLNWMMEKLANLGKGDSRNAMLYWAGRYIAGGESSDWVVRHRDLLYDVTERVVDAFSQNGYMREWANGSDREIRRVFMAGKRAGGSRWAEPEFNESWFAFDVGMVVDVHKDGEFLKRGRITEQKRPLGQGGERFAAYRLNGDNTIYGEWMLSMSEEVYPELNEVHPPLTPSQKMQVSSIIKVKELEAWQKALTTLQPDTPVDRQLLQWFNGGYRRQVNEDGEITGRDVVIPLLWDGEIVNVEYTSLIDESYQYEFDTAAPGLIVPAESKCTRTIVMPDTMSAIQFFGRYGDANTSVVGLPQLELSESCISAFGDDVVFFTWKDDQLKGRGLRPLYNCGKSLREVRLPLPFLSLSGIGKDVVDSLIVDGRPL